MLEITHLEKSFGATKVLSDVSLDVARGELFTLLGASGCGKTTLLRIIAGLERPDAGRITFDGTPWVDDDGTFVTPQRRGIGLVFQSYAIWPHLSVFDQVAYPLRSRGTARAEIRPRVLAALEAVGMAAFAERSAQQLSGGQQQRVAMARALVAEPALLLLDEPFSNLDVALRDQLRLELRQIQKRLGITIVLVTHDQADAFALSDRIAVMRHGVVEQIGSPEDIYQRPATAFVRGFVGRSSRLSGTWSGANAVAIGADTPLPVAGDNSAALAHGAPVALLVRPQDVQLVERHTPLNGAPVLPGRIVDRLFVGDRYECLIELEGGQSLVVYQEIGASAPADIAVRFDRLPEVYPA
jgi:ABC-type Fe3+/spermidine/putrescine transport system ATPase subunit